MKPTFRRETLPAIYQAVARAITDVCVKESLQHSCLNCIHFDERDEGCGLANGIRPPARVIAYGCNSWDDKDEIPF